MSKLDEILEALYLEGYRDSTRRASGRVPHAHATKNRLKRLVLELIGPNDVLDPLPADRTASQIIESDTRDALRSELRHKVEAL